MGGRNHKQSPEGYHIDVLDEVELDFGLEK